MLCILDCQSIRWVHHPDLWYLGTGPARRTRILPGPDEEEQERVIHQQILMPGKKNEVRQQILCQFWDLSNLEQKKSQEELDESPYKYYKCSSMAGSLWIPDLSVSSNLGFRPGQVYPRNSSSNLSWRLPRNKTGLQPGM